MGTNIVPHIRNTGSGSHIVSEPMLEHSRVTTLTISSTVIKQSRSPGALMEEASPNRVPNYLGPKVGAPLLTSPIISLQCLAAFLAPNTTVF